MLLEPTAEPTTATGPIPNMATGPIVTREMAREHLTAEGKPRAAAHSTHEDCTHLPNMAAAPSMHEDCTALGALRTPDLYMLWVPHMHVGGHVLRVADSRPLHAVRGHVMWHRHTHIHMHMHMHRHIHIYMCIHIHMCRWVAMFCGTGPGLMVLSNVAQIAISRAGAYTSAAHTAC